MPAAGFRRAFLAMSALLALGAVASFGLFAWPRWSQARAAEAWPTVEGTVVDAWVGTHRGSRSGGGGRSRTTHRAEVLVRYEVDGVALVTDRDGFGSVSTGGLEEVRRQVRERSPGTVVTLRRDPVDPAVATLGTGGSWVPFVLPGVLLLMAVVFATLSRFLRPMNLGTVDLSPLRRLGGILLGIVSLGFLAVGGFVTSIGIGRVRTTLAAAAWPERPATVVRSEWTLTPRDGAAATDAVATRPRIEAKAAIAYRYEVDGTPRESDAVAPVPLAHDSLEDWNRRILAYRPGKTVSIRVDPADPARTALEIPGLAGDGVSLAAASTVCGLGLAGIAGSVRLVRRRRG
jgi:hypothetical protein